MARRWPNQPPAVPSVGWLLELAPHRRAIDGWLGACSEVGYGRGELTPSELVRRRLYSLHLILIVVIETVYRQYADTAQYSWGRQQLTEILRSLGW